MNSGNVFPVSGGVSERHGTSRALDRLAGVHVMGEHVAAEGMPGRQTRAANFAHAGLERKKKEKRIQINILFFQ